MEHRNETIALSDHDMFNKIQIGREHHLGKEGWMLFGFPYIFAIILIIGLLIWLIFSNLESIKNEQPARAT